MMLQLGMPIGWEGIHLSHQHIIHKSYPKSHSQNHDLNHNPNTAPNHTPNHTPKSSPNHTPQSHHKDIVSHQPLSYIFDLQVNTHSTPFLRQLVLVITESDTNSFAFVCQI